jgi:hypothetical protein
LPLLACLRTCACLRAGISTLVVKNAVRDGIASLEIFNCSSRRWYEK